MIFVILGVATPFAVVLWLLVRSIRSGGLARSWREADDLERVIGILFAAIFFSVITALSGGAGLGISAAMGAAFPSERTCHELSLVSLQDNQGLEGRFFLGTGYIESAMKFAFYYESGPESFRLRVIDADDAAIYQDEANRPYALVCEVDTGRWRNWFAPDFRGDVYEMHIPEGSILSNYNLDAR